VQAHEPRVVRWPCGSLPCIYIFSPWYEGLVSSLTRPLWNITRLCFDSLYSTRDSRNRLHGDTTEAIECLKSWRKIQTIRLESEIESDVRLKLDQMTG
jgi:hypothetical protein